MTDIRHWKRAGFVFEARFPNEYDLWVNRETMQKLRRYVDGGEWLSDPTTGEYVLASDPDVQTNRADIGSPAPSVLPCCDIDSVCHFRIGGRGGICPVPNSRCDARDKPIKPNTKQRKGKSS